jgi:hypothetical protein
MPTLDKRTLERIVPQFHKFLDSEEGRQWKQDRVEKDAFFETYFSETEIDNLEEGTLRELIHTLWAFNGWTNKDWLLQEMLQSGLPTIRRLFRELLYGDEPLAKRFNGVIKGIRMMGPTCVSEVLSHHHPNQYPIWSRRSKQGLIGLGIEAAQLPKSPQISGSQYAAFCDLVTGVRDQIAEDYPEFDDLLKLDFLLYFVSTQETPTVSPTEDIEDFDHDNVIDQVLELGDGLGFEVDKEFTVMRGCRIDAIWRSRVANLGTIAYAFEIHRRGSRDSAILNLQRVKRDPSIQKVVLVSNKEELDRFKGESASLSENFRMSVGYFEVDDLERALSHLQSLKDILNTLGLLSTESLFD